MKNLESPAKAQRDQRRKLAFVPPLWPLLAIIAVVVLIVFLTR